VVFLLEAEGGIRDWSVTGVQTCALPISGVRPPAGSGADRGRAPFPGRATAGLRRESGCRAADVDGPVPDAPGQQRLPVRGMTFGDRKSVVEGKRVGMGGRRMRVEKSEAT